MKRYQNLMVGEALSKNHLYPFACNELSSILNFAYSRLPKNIKALIFQDTLSAFRLLPDVNTSAAVSAANLLLKSVEAMLPKQKKNLVIVEFKQAKVALKRRRSKSHEEDIGNSFVFVLQFSSLKTRDNPSPLANPFSDLPSLPQDILIHIFSFLDVPCLLSSSQVSHSWNLATSDVSLWQSQFDLHFNHKVLIRSQSRIEWREAFKKAYIADNSSKVLRSGRGYCSCCNSIVWHDNLRCLDKQCQLKPLNLISTHQVVNYLLGIENSSDESESDEEAVPGLWAYHRTLH